MILQSHGTGFMKSVELYVGDHLEMVRHPTVTLGRDCLVMVNSYHGLEMFVLVCNLSKYLYYRRASL